jgi:hypothetical protein
MNVTRRKIFSQRSYRFTELHGFSQILKAGWLTSTAKRQYRTWAFSLIFLITFIKSILILSHNHFFRLQNDAQQEDLKSYGNLFPSLAGIAQSMQRLAARWKTRGFRVRAPIESSIFSSLYLRDLGEVGWGDVDWIGLAQDRNRWRALVNSVLNLRVP